MPGKDKRLKSFEIIDDTSEVDKISSAFVLPVNDNEADLIIVDDVGDTRTIRSGGGDKTWIHDQFIPATVWTIVHNLGKKPTVTVVDTANTVVEGVIDYGNSLNQLTITFNYPFSGYATLN